MQFNTNELFRETSNTYNKKQDRRANEIEASKSRSFAERMAKLEAEQRKKEIFIEDSLRQLQNEKDKNFAFKMDSSNKAHEAVIREIDRKYEGKKDSSKFAQNLIQTIELMNLQSKTNRAEFEEKLEQEKIQRDELIENEKKALREKYMAPNLRGKFADFFDEEGGLMNFGLNESDLIAGYDKGQADLNLAVSNIKSMGIPKSSPQRQKIENLVLDMWKHINRDDMGADFLDGGGFLGALGLENKQATQAQGIYDELESILMQLGVPQEEWQNRLWVK